MGERRGAHCLEQEPRMQPGIESRAGVLGPPFSCLAASLPWGLATLDHLKTQQKEQRKMFLSLEGQGPM